MKILAKILSVFTNFSSYAVGIAVAIILIFKKDFISIFYLNGMTSNESLYFNMLLFEIGLALAGIIICMLAKEYGAKEITVEFPTIFAVIPLVISAISIYYGITGETVREKIFIIICSIIYFALSAIILYTGAKVFQIYPNTTSKSNK
jgi:hypothetical protein